MYKKKGYSSTVILTIIVFVLFFSIPCQGINIYQEIVDHYLNEFVGKKFGVDDLTEEDWREVGFSTYDGQRTLSGFYKQADAPMFNVVYVHGYDRRGKYQYFTDYSSFRLFTNQSTDYRYNLLAVELSGWGKEDHVCRNYKDYVNDVLGGVKYIKSISPSLPTIVVGHSLGGYSSLLSATYDDQDLIDGVISLSPLTNMVTAIRNEDAPWYIRAIVGRTDDNLNEFFSRYSLLRRGDKIEVPTLIITGKKDVSVFPMMGLDIYRTLETDKQFYLMRAGHSAFYHSQSRQLSKIFNDFFRTILSNEMVGNKRLEQVEIKLDYSIRSVDRGYEITVSPRANIESDYLALDIFFNKGREVAFKKYLFRPNDTEATFIIPFNPEDIYAFRPVGIEIDNNQWRYKMSEEEAAFYHLRNLEKEDYRTLTVQDMEAIKTLMESDKIYYREILADSILWKKIGSYRLSILVYKSIINEPGIDEDYKVRALYKTYHLYRDYLKNEDKAIDVYNQLAQYDHTKYYVNQAVQYQKQNLDLEDTDYTIGEIKIEGLARTEKDIISRQMTYTVGDKWTEELKRLTEQRLAQLKILNPYELKVINEKMGHNQVKIIVQAQDTNPFMVHPVEYLINRTIDLKNSQFEQRVRNPMGNGLSIYGGVGWNHHSWAKVGLDYTGGDGQIYAGEYLKYNHLQPLSTNYYREVGEKVKLSFNKIPQVDKRLTYSLTYQDGWLKYIDSKKEQQLLILGSQFEWDKYGLLEIDYNVGIPLIAGQDKFYSLELEWRDQFTLDNDQLLYSIKSGLASDNTPLNFRFVGGGYCSIPLRGHKQNLIGDRYLIYNMEYHKKLGYDWIKGVVFIDGGKLVDEQKSFSREDWEIDGGVGIALSSPLGPVRLDIGLDHLKAKPKYNLTIGHTF